MGAESRVILLPGVPGATRSRKTWRRIFPKILQREHGHSKTLILYLCPPERFKPPSLWYVVISMAALGKYTSMFYWLRETMSLEGAICYILLFCLDAACETTSSWTIIKENPLNYKNMPCLCSPKSSGQIKISFLLESNLSFGIMESGIIIEWTSDFKNAKMDLVTC